MSRSYGYSYAPMYALTGPLPSCSTWRAPTLQFLTSFVELKQLRAFLISNDVVLLHRKLNEGRQ